ncbi:MAG: serine hydrolase [Candidatus Aminicenantes bacterium]|nr:serine hydrolase [Candidatus Aminicenantes bacterium]
MTRKTFFSLLICLFLLQISFAQRTGETGFHDESVMPPGKKGERIQSIIDTVNANDPDRIRRFMEEECTEKFRNFAPVDRHIEFILGVFQETGGLAFHSIRTYVPERKGETVIIVKDHNFDSWRAFTLRFDGSEAYLVDDLQFNYARTPSNVSEPDISEEEFLRQTREMMERLCDKDVFSGTLLVAKDENILYTFVCGEASKRFHVPNNIDTKFNLGSMNKMFTATSIVRLAEEGKLSFEDPISKYVDESWLPREITDRITIHHLLTHSSGLGSYFNEKFMNGSRLLYRDVDDYKPLIKDEKPAFEPGKRFQYSNTGMFLLGVVIESITEGSYFDYIRKNIYEPAGMKNSDSFEMDYPVENLAIGYSPERSRPWKWKNNIFMHVVKGGPAGGGFSTVGDLHRFALALKSGKLVSKESLEKLWTDYLGANYGYGFQVEEGPKGKVVGHGGGFPGINGKLDIYLDRGYIVAVLSNYDMGASPVARKIGELIERVK